MSFVVFDGNFKLHSLLYSKYLTLMKNKVIMLNNCSLPFNFKVFCKYDLIHQNFLYSRDLCAQQAEIGKARQTGLMVKFCNFCLTTSLLRIFLKATNESKKVGKIFLN